MMTVKDASKGVAETNDFVELKRVFSSVLRWWWLLILATAIAALVGYWVSNSQPRVYRAAATILVGQSIRTTALDSRDMQTAERLALTYANIGRRQPVLQGVVETLQLNDTWQQLKKRVNITPVEATQLLVIRVEAGSREAATIIADEVAHQLILLSPTALEDQQQDETQRVMRRRLGELQAKIEAGQADREALEEAIMGASTAKELEDLRAQINSLDRLITDWEKNHTDLLIFVESRKTSNYLTVIEPAQANPSPVRPNVRLNTLMAGVVGFFLALGVVFLLEYLDNTLKTADDLSQSLGLIPLGTVGRIDGKTYRDKLIVSQDTFSAASEAYRMIRSNIQFTSVDRPAKTILITSPSPQEGKSVTTANLAVAMAQAGLKTILVDADLRRPTQHRFFNDPNLLGLTDLLCSSELELNSRLRNTKVENLQLITCGLTPPNPSELLGSQRMGQLLASLEEVADVVLIDSPPAAALADAAVLSNRVDGVILVTLAGRTRRDVARQAVMNLQQTGANLLGGVLNGSSKREGVYERYASERQVRSVQPGPARLRQFWQRLSFIK